jgi:hypothetical protein
LVAIKHPGKNLQQQRRGTKIPNIKPTKTRKRKSAALKKQTKKHSDKTEMILLYLHKKDNAI